LTQSGVWQLNSSGSSMLKVMKISVKMSGSSMRLWRSTCSAGGNVIEARCLICLLSVCCLAVESTRGHSRCHQMWVNETHTRRSQKITPTIFCLSRAAFKFSTVNAILRPPHTIPIAAAGTIDTMWFDSTVCTCSQ
jgi:hypothetical protein